MINDKHCGNCSHWKDAKPTAHGKLPYYGNCEMGYPLKAGQKYKRNGFNYVYKDFTARSDGLNCKEWSSAE